MASQEYTSVIAASAPAQTDATGSVEQLASTDQTVQPDQTTTLRRDQNAEQDAAASADQTTQQESQQVLDDFVIETLQRTRAAFKQQFPDIIISPDGSTFFYNRENGYAVPATYDLLNMFLMPEQIQQIRVRQSYFRNISSIVPDDKRHQFCVVYGGKVLAAFDKLEDAITYKDTTAAGLDVSIYNPPLNLEPSAPHASLRMPCDCCDHVDEEEEHHDEEQARSTDVTETRDIRSDA